MPPHGNVVQLRPVTIMWEKGNKVGQGNCMMMLGEGRTVGAEAKAQRNNWPGDTTAR